MGGYLDKLGRILGRPDEVALAMVKVPDYDRRSDRGNPVHVGGYSRMGRDAAASHLTGSHGMKSSAFGKDFAHPQSLNAWHSMDHLARGDGLDHQHPGEDHAGHVAAHLGGGEHEHGGAAAIAGHAAIYEGPAMAHREVRRNLDRQTRRRLYRVASKHKGGKKPPGGSGAASGASGSSSGGGGGSGGSGGSSGSSGGGQ